MKIAIACEEKNVDSEISLKGGRAPYYIIFEDKKIIEIMKNPFAKGGGGAGFSVAHMMFEKDVELVIGGKFGVNMENSLNEKDIKFEEKTGIVNEVLEKI